MEIRNPNKTHWPALQPLILEALGPTWSAQAVADRIFYDEAYDPNHVWFAREAGQMLGFLHSSLDGSEARVKLLVVAPSARRKGLGRDLLSRAEYRLSGEGAREAWVAPSPPMEFFPGVLPGSDGEAFLAAQGYEAAGETELAWAEPIGPLEAPPLDRPAAVDFGREHCREDWGWAEESLAARQPRALFVPAAGLILFEAGVSVGPLWPAPGADDGALDALSRRALAAASAKAPIDARGLRLHGGHAEAPFLDAVSTETRILYRKPLS